MEIKERASGEKIVYDLYSDGLLIATGLENNDEENTESTIHRYNEYIDRLRHYRFKIEKTQFKDGYLACTIS